MILSFMMWRKSASLGRILDVLMMLFS